LLEGKETQSVILSIPLVCDFKLVFDDAPKLFGYIEDYDRTQRPHALTTALFPAWPTSPSSWVELADEIVHERVQQIRTEASRLLYGEHTYRIRQVGKHRLHILSWPPTEKRAYWVLLSASDNGICFVLRDGICFVLRDLPASMEVSFNDDEWLATTMRVLSENL
jgi:hypothetical protein